MTADRRTPTPGSPTVQPGGTYADAVNEEIAASFNGFGCFVENPAGVNDITGTVIPPLDAWQKGQLYYLEPPAINTGAVRVDVGRGFKVAVKVNGSAFTGGELQPGSVYPFVYNGTNLRQLAIPGVAGSPGGPGAPGQYLTRSTLQAASLVDQQLTLLLGRSTPGDGGGGIFVGTNDDLSAILIGSMLTSTAVDSGTETITIDAALLRREMQCIVTAAVDGLSTNTRYFIDRISATTIKLATSRANLLAGTYVNLTGTTNITIKVLTDPEQGYYVIPTGSALDGSAGAWVRQSALKSNGEWFGMVPDGEYSAGVQGYIGTDSTPGLNNLVFFSYFRHVAAFTADGDYCLARQSGTQKAYVSVPSWCVIRGQSQDGTRFLIDYDFDEVTVGLKNNMLFASPDPFGASVAYDTSELFDAADFTVRGLLEEHPWPTDNVNYRVHGFRIKNTSIFRLERVTGHGISASFVTNQWNGESEFMHCRIYKIAGTGFRSLGGKRCFFSHLKIKYCEDDTIDCHSGNDAATETRGAVVIVSCQIEDAEGIAVLGIRHMVIQANTLRRTRRSCIQANGNTSSEGRGNAGSVVISGNTIEDPFGEVDPDTADPAVFAVQSDFWGAIVVEGGKITDTTDSGDYPGQYDGTSTVEDPWAIGGTTPPIGAMQDPDWTLSSNAAAGGVVISGNAIRRTLPLAANYSDFGLGNWWRRTGEVDPEVTEVAFRKHGIVLLGALRGFQVSGNDISGFRQGAGVYFYLNATLADLDQYLFENGLVAGNTILDCQQPISSNVRGGATSYNFDVVFDGNILGADPYCKSSYRTSPLDGTWADSTATDVPAGMDMRQLQNWTARRNVFRNCQIPILGTVGYEDQNHIEANLVECDPGASGAILYNANNKGVGNIPRPGPSWFHKIVDCNPTSATWRQVKNSCALQGTAKPTAGTWLAGHFVRKSNLSVATSHVIFGWVRLTTGTGNSASEGVDWQTVYFKTSTA